MPEREPNAIAVFESIHHVLAAERAFHDQGLWCDLVPAPRAISSDCGMVLEFHTSERVPARTLLMDPRLRLKGIYLPSAGGFVQWNPDGD